MIFFGLTGATPFIMEHQLYFMGITTDNELLMQADISNFNRNINFRILQTTTLVTSAEKCDLQYFTFLLLPKLSYQ